MINKKEKNEIKEGFFDEKDFISPSYINLNNPRFLEIDDYFYSGITIVNYYREYNDLILKSLIETSINMNISVFVRFSAEIFFNIRIGSNHIRRP